MEERFAQRHPELLVPLIVFFTLLVLAIGLPLIIMLDSTPPEFSATVSGYEGLVRSA
jgi:hypothetical protein